MPAGPIKIEGLKGLPSLRNLSRADYNAWVKNNSKYLRGTWTIDQADELYQAQKFNEIYGKGAHSNYTKDQRRRALQQYVDQYNDRILTQAIENRWSPFREDGTVDSNKGVGDANLYYQILSMDNLGKQELLESSYSTRKEHDDYYKTAREVLNDRVLKGNTFTPAYSPGGGTTSLEAKELLEQEKEAWMQNTVLFEGIYAKSLKRKTKALEPAVTRYAQQLKSQYSENEIKSLFRKITKPKEGEGPAYRYAAYFDDEGNSIADETEDFSIEDMTNFIAKFNVYNANFDPMTTYNALNNEATEYISDHQNRFYRGASDIFTTAGVKLADNWNGMRRITLVGQEAEVFVTSDGEVVPTDLVETLDDGNPYYKKGATLVPVTKTKRSLLALDDLGKDEYGNDKVWINNQRYWSNAERFGTFDRAELAEYEKIGYSPYQMVWNPGDDASIMYEVGKMYGFAAADVTMTALPTGMMKGGLTIINKVSDLVGTTRKGLNALGQTLYWSGKVGTIASPYVSAIGMGNMTGRGIFGEAYEGNLQKLEESVTRHAEQEVHRLYTTDEGYRESVDAEVQQRYSEAMQQYLERYGTDDLSDQERADIMNNILRSVQSNRVQAWAEEYKKSDAYRSAVSAAIESASDAAFLGATTSALKESVVNLWGWRKFLFKNPKRLANSHTGETLEGVTETVTSTGKRNLTSRFDFLTSPDKRKQFLKIAGKEMISGGLDEMTDEFLEGGARAVNEDRMSQYIQDLYNPKAKEFSYSGWAGIASYLNSISETAMDPNTYKAGLVGAISPITTITPNIGSILSPEFKEQWKNSNFRERTNMLVSNGILNEYYAKKYNQTQMKKSVDTVNKILDDYGDFEDLNQAIALDMALADVTNPEDARGLTYLKGVYSMALLDRFKKDKDLVKVASQSSIFSRALSIIEKLANPSSLSAEEVSDFLAQYYVENPGVAKSEEQDKIALQELQDRARRLQDSYNTYNEVESTLRKVEQSRGTALPEAVRGRLMQRLILNKYLADRIKELEKNITGSETTNDSESVIESYGTEGHQRSKVRSMDYLISTVDEQITKAKEALAKAQKDMDDFNSTPQSNLDNTKRKQLQTAINNARIHVENLNNLKNGLALKKESLENQASWNKEDNTTASQRALQARVLSAEEILRLNPQDRARMLNNENFKNYSEKQQAEIIKAREELMLRDPSLLDDVQNQVRLYRQHRANSRAYTMMMENPEAAAFQLESAKKQDSIEAAAYEYERKAVSIDDTFKKWFEEYGDNKDTRDAIYNSLRALNPEFLNYMKGFSEFDYMQQELEEALSWSEVATDMSKVISSMKLDENAETAFRQSLDNVIYNARTKEEVLNTLGRVIESEGVNDSDKATFEKMLNELEQLWNQRSSTTSTTREERQVAEAARQKKAAEEAKRKEEAEKAAKEEAERKAAELAANGVSEDDTKTDNESSVSSEQIQEAVEEGEPVSLEEDSFESPSVEEQVNTNPEEVDVIPTPTDDSTDQGNNLPKGESTTLVGNSMYRYDTETMKHEGKQVPRKGKNPGDSMDRYFAWMEAAGVKIQEIIDDELTEIAALDIEVYPMFVRGDKNATDDEAMMGYPLLVVEYTPEVAAIHNEKNGGVITSNGKQYLIIGTLGFAKGNKEQGNVFRRILNSPRKPFFNSHPSERFYVNTDVHTKVQQISAGRLVRQLATDEKVNPHRTIAELLEESRNPKGLTISDLKWGIQYDNEFITVRVSEDKKNKIYPPSDRGSNVGSVFLLVEAANGYYVPAYIRPTRLAEIKEGKLKETIKGLIRELQSSNYATREEAAKKLRHYLHLDKEGDWILYGTPNNPTITIQQNGVKKRTFNLANPDPNEKSLEEVIIEELNPRINITTSILLSDASIEMYDEAGALTTDLAKLGTSNASYNVYTIDAEGNPIIPTTVENPAPKVEENSDLSKAQKKLDSIQIGKDVYRKKSDGNWYTEGEKLVTDERLIEQLNYRHIIRSRDLKPDKVIGSDEIFVVNSDKDNPLVLVRRKGNYIFAMSKEGAVKTINEVNAELAEKARQERLQKEMEKERGEEETLSNMSEEAKRKAAKEGESVDLGLDETASTPEEESPDTSLTPQQKAAEELVERIHVDSSTIQLSEDGATYVDADGKHYARVTSIIAADETADDRFDSNSPWALPSTTIGTGIDNFVRDFFAGNIGNLDNLEERYPNASNAQLRKFAEQLEQLAIQFRQRGLTIVPHDVTLTGTVEVKTANGEKKVIDVAGTVDLLAYDKDGNFYIFDMKTNRSAPTGEAGKKKRAKWSKQLSLYKQLLQEKYGATVKELAVIPIEVTYPHPNIVKYSEKDEQLYADEEEYRLASPVLHNNIPIPETALSISYNKLTSAEQVMVRTVEGSKPTKKEDEKTTPIVQPEPIKTEEDINSTGTKSLAELQSEKSLNTALAIIKSRTFGARVRKLLRSKFPDMPKNMSEIERFLQSKGIATTGITDVEQWIDMIENCK